MSVTHLQLGPASVLWTSGADGHLGHNPPRGRHDENCCGPEANERRSAVLPGEWKYLTQVHGTSVTVVDSNTAPGAEADAAVTADPSVTLAIATADCAPIALSSEEGVIGAVHAGWTGLSLGVVRNAVNVMRSLGATDIVAALGPCIHAECYEFGNEQLQPLVDRWGEEVRGQTSTGAPAFGLPAAVAKELGSVGAELMHVDDRCTACSGEFFSFRTTATSDRQVMLVRRVA